jgi:hypothetical protein
MRETILESHNSDSAADKTFSRALNAMGSSTTGVVVGDFAKAGIPSRVQDVVKF